MTNRVQVVSKQEAFVLYMVQGWNNEYYSLTCSLCLCKLTTGGGGGGLTYHNLHRYNKIHHHRPGRNKKTCILFHPEEAAQRFILHALVVSRGLNERASTPARVGCMYFNEYT